MKRQQRLRIGEASAGSKPARRPRPSQTELHEMGKHLR